MKAKNTCMDSVKKRCGFSRNVPENDLGDCRTSPPPHYPIPIPQPSRKIVPQVGQTSSNLTTTLAVFLPVATHNNTSVFVDFADAILNNNKSAYFTISSEEEGCFFFFLTGRHGYPSTVICLGSHHRYTIQKPVSLCDIRGSTHAVCSRELERHVNY